jgi:TetR/AcrR family transcriptional regulator, cholesterol catabolism regulator
MATNEVIETETKVLRAATVLFAEKGFKETSVRDIATATGMTMSNIYYYYGSKEGLLLAVLEQFWKHMEEGLSRVIELDLPPLERFKLLVKTHLRLILSEYRNEAKIAMVEEHEWISSQLHRKALDIYRKELQSLQNLGHVDRNSNATLLSFYILGSIIWHLRWHNPDGQVPFDKVTEQLVNFVLNGILNGSASDRQVAEKP